MYKLSIVEKAKRYDEAIKKLRSLHNDYDTVSTLIDIKEELENIFPELAESEDEKIRKAMIKYFTNGKEYLSLTPYSREDYIAWIEKQGEKNEDNPPFNDPKYLDGFDTGREVQKIFDEQNPAEWSKDDEENLYHIDALIKDSSLEVRRQEYLSNWLKSLKDRFTWKPSDEQMMALNYVVNLMASSERPTENDLYYNILKSLKEQLKKLREE